MNAAAFLDIVEQIEAWEQSEEPTALAATPFYDLIVDQRLEVPVGKLRKSLSKGQRQWLWAKIKTRLALLVTRGSLRHLDGRPVRGEWQIKIPAAPCGWLNANKRRDRRVEARLRSEWRGHVYRCGWNERQRLPQGLDYVKVDLQFQVDSYRLRDNANLAPTAKPIVDAFGPERKYLREGKPVHEQGLGVYVGDDPTHMAAGGAFLDWFDEAHTGPGDGVVWMRIIDLSPRRPTEVVP